MGDKFIDLIRHCGDCPMLKKAIYILISEKPDIVNRHETDEPPLTVACEEENLELIEYLLQKGADPNYQDNDGRTQLMVMNHSPTIVGLLLKYGAKTNLQDKFGETALMYAVREMSANINISYRSIRLMVTYGADLNIKDHQGMTALMYNAQNCFDVDGIVYDLLIDFGADFNLRNKKGLTASQIAEKYAEMKAILREAISKKSD